MVGNDKNSSSYKSKTAMVVSVPDMNLLNERYVFNKNVNIDTQESTM